MRSSNLRPAPRWITPDVVKRVLELAMPAGATTMPVFTVPMRGIVPQLEIVPATFSNPPEEHARRSDEREAAPNGPTAAASPPRSKDHNERRKAETAAQIKVKRDLYREQLARAAKTRRDKRAAEVERLRQERVAAAERRRLARIAAAEQRRADGELRKAESRRQREIAAADRRKSKPNAIREVTPAAICRPADPVPSREPALSAPRQARAHPITIVRERPNAPRHINYAERMNAAIAHLRARSFVVQRHNRDELIARWHVSGWTGLFSNEQLVALAQHHGLELRA